ncbi:uncharacterized protein [Hemitrygon akajei]|uniref:uncharacterized protein isoform X2 n=1 Tax=Hemitrygon akajei TaxID=2704970 RepID=UPI003BF95C0E
MVTLIYVSDHASGMEQKGMSQRSQRERNVASELQVENPKYIYIFDKTDQIVFTGPDIPGNGPVGWDWKPSYIQGIQRLVTFYKEGSREWTPLWERNFIYTGIFQAMDNTAGTVDLIITRPTFKFTGSIILVQREPSYETLKQYEIFGIEVVANPQSPLKGSDVILSCTISRLPDTVSLHWKPVDSSQQNRRNTDQIRLNNTVYLMLRHVTVEDGKLYQCEVRENGNIVLTSKADFTVDKGPYNKHYTLYRSVMDHSEFHLMCYSSTEHYNNAAWTWLSHLHQSSRKTIATAFKSQPMNVSESHFVNRLMLTKTPFNGWNFSMRVFPVVFEDAGEYTCTLETITFMTIRLSTVKVTAEPSDTVTEGVTVTLNCSVSDVPASTRLVWINGDGETVGEKTLSGEEKSLSLVIQKADRGRGKWTCGVFDQKTLQLSVPYNLEFRADNNTNKIAIIGSLVLLLIIILGLVLCFKKYKRKDSGNQNQKPLQTGGNKEETSHLYSNAVEIQQMQGDLTPVTETSHVAEYMSVHNQSKQEDTKEAIHYEDIYFKNESSGSRHEMQDSDKSSIVNVGDDEHVVIYTQIAQVAYE